MITAIPRASVTSAGARPVKGPSQSERSRQKVVAAFQKIGSFARVRMESLEEGDVFSNHLGTFCVVRKALSCRGSVISIRDMATRNVKGMRYEPRVWLLRVRLPEVLEHKGQNWRIRCGDVVVFPGNRADHATVAIRHARAWYPTSAPWLPLGDAEIVLALKERRAFVLRNSVRQGDPRVPDVLPLGMVVATRDVSVKEPSVFIQTAPNHWTSNSRGAALSTEMVKYELGRGTYQALRLPEVGT